MSPEISIAISTMGSRRSDLAACLESLIAVRGIERQEVLVVTRRGDRLLDDLLAGYTGRLPLRALEAGTEALSDKRNVAAREGRGEIVAYVDDDATVGPEYVERLREAFAGPRVECVGGALEPVFDVLPEGELRECAFHIGGFNRWDGRERAGAWAGANCAFRRRSLLEAGAFDVRLGPGGSYLPWGDDSEMFDRFRRRGTAVFAPRLLVRHRIQRERTTVAYVLARSFRNGRTQCVIDRLHRRDFWRGALVVPVMLAREALRAAPGFPLESRIRLRRLIGYVYQSGLVLAGASPR